MNMEKSKIGMLLFPDITIQDFAGPYDVFIRADCFEVYIVSEQAGLISAEGGLSVKAELSFDDCPQFDIIFVPGGKGINPLLQNKTYIQFLQKQALGARFITSVCTGSLLLAASGLLTGYKATTHWRSGELLQMFGVEVTEERVVIDRNRITGGGVTSGLDFALTLTSLLGGDTMAKTVQLLLEYDPLPPFNSGSTGTAEPEILEKAREITQPLFDSRMRIISSLLLDKKQRSS
jgi:cyclohexyl-isocyanide hydratase